MHTRWANRLLLILTLAASAACGQHGHDGGHAVPGPPPLPEAVEVPPSGATLPLLDFGGRPVVDILINGKGPYRFIVDTGARLSVIDATLNDELELPAAEGVRAASVGGRPGPVIVSVRELRAGAVALRGLIAAVMPLQPLLGTNGPRGVLSASNFPGYLLTLDYPSKRISIRKGALDKADSENIFDYPAGDALPTVPIRVAGQQTRVHLDTGSPAGLTLPTKFQKELPLASELRDTGKVRTPSGEYPVARAKVDGAIELGRHTLALAEIEFCDVRPGSSVPSTGQIGAQVLRNFIVTLDTRNRRIRFAP